MKRLLLLALLALIWCGASPSQAQVASAYTVSACGGQSLPAGQAFPLEMTLTGNLCTNASGGGGGGGAITAPLGPTTAPSAAVAITDTGTPITGQTIGAGGQGLIGWLSQIVAGVNSSIPAGSNVIGGVTAADGALATEGAKSDTAYAGSGSASIVAALKGLYNAVTSAIPAGSAIIGKVGIDQTTPGTTNGVQINAALPAGTNLLGKTGIDQTTPGTTNGVAIVQGGNTAVVKAASTPSVATDQAVVVDVRPNCGACAPNGPAAVSGAIPFVLSSQYPVNNVTTTPTAVTATATGTTAATVATIPAVASKTAYICGFTITADATALAVGTAVVSGTISGSLSYLQGISAVTSGAGNLTQAFNPCIPASGVNTAIVVTSAAAGTGGNTIVNAQGYYL